MSFRDMLLKKVVKDDSKKVSPRSRVAEKRDEIKCYKKDGSKDTKNDDKNIKEEKILPLKRETVVDEIKKQSQIEIKSQIEVKSNPDPEIKPSSFVALEHLIVKSHKEPLRNKIALSVANGGAKQQGFVRLATSIRQRRKFGYVYYPIEYEASFDKTEIAMPKHMRDYLGYKENTEISGVKVINKETLLPPIAAYQVDIQIRQLKGTNSASETIMPEEFTNLIKKYFKDYPLIPNQVVLMPHPDKENLYYELLIEGINFESSIAEENVIPCVYTLNDATDVNLSVSDIASNQKVRINNARKLNLDFASKGIGGFKEELERICRAAFLSRTLDTEVVKAYGIKHQKGILLYGPPGTGKSYIAERIGKIFYDSDEKSPILVKKKTKVTVINGPELKNKMVGQSAENLRNIFAPAIKEWKEKKEESDVHVIIIDELDSLAPPRGSRSGGTGVEEDMVATLLTLIEGIDSPQNILILATTNRIDGIDPALLRPGRISTHVKIGLPDQESRLAMLEIHTQKPRESKLLDESVDLRFWAEKTENYTAAEIQNLVEITREFALKTICNPDSKVLEVKKELKEISQYAKITQEHFEKAFAEIVPKFGINKKNFNFDENNFIIFSDEMSDIKEKYHECLTAMEDEKGLQGFRFLISGENGTGKTELAKYLASISHARYIKIISPNDLINLPLAQCLEKLDLEFLDAQHSERSVIILDEIENLLEAEFDLTHPVNLLRIKLQSLLKAIPNSENKCIVIGTTKSTEFINKMLPGMFDDFNQTENVIIEYSKKEDVMRLEQIAKLFNITVIPPKSLSESQDKDLMMDKDIEDTRKINLSIGKLIFEIKRFCKNEEKLNVLNLDDFYHFLHKKTAHKLFSRSVSLHEHKDDVIALKPIRVIR